MFPHEHIWPICLLKWAIFSDYLWHSIRNAYLGNSAYLKILYTRLHLGVFACITKPPVFACLLWIASYLWSPQSRCINVWLMMNHQFTPNHPWSESRIQWPVTPLHSISLAYHQKQSCVGSLTSMMLMSWWFSIYCKGFNHGIVLSFCIFYSIHLHHLHWLPNNWQWLKTDITIDLVWTCLCLIGWRGKWYVRIPYSKQTFKEWLKIFFTSNQSLFGSQLCGLLTHLISKVQRNEWKLTFNSLSLKLTPISYEISFWTL